MFWLIIFITWSIFFWDFYLSIRQYRVHRDAVKRPDEVSEIMSEEEYRKARIYRLDKHHFSFVYSIYSQLELMVILIFYLPQILWSKSGNFNLRFGFTSEIAQTITFISLVSIIECLMSIPWQLYDTFVIEEKHGFNKQTLGFFLKDKTKKTIISLFLMAPIVAAIVYIVERGGPYFFLYIWIFLSVVIFLLMTVYPEFIAPLFDKYVPLPESELKQKIEKLARSLNFPLKKLLVVYGSKRSAHSNAYLYGFWNNKRIVLYDTLFGEEMRAKLKETACFPTENEEKSYDKGDEEIKERKLGMQDDEVLAVLGHEFGHWALWHAVIQLFFAEINLLLLLAIFAKFYQSTSLFHAFGFYDSKPIIIGFMIVFQYITAPYNELFSFLATIMSRRLEFAADHFSEKLGYGYELRKALIKLGKDNLVLPIDDPLYSMFNHSHPPVLERIAALKKVK
ncbi:Peptidase family M48 containing protein [Brugia malayi]|uniref:CAAX prenyl protease n=2 Tax=Brugia malayi TaxID=6279 RepID=A0A4E9FFB0_BRUMA|nr:Peptidase family M48 containing protein [Brugia malayi]VIO95621.1 Peptidase family M48 containing protein [Brugia malayi]